ncbi:MULTISPECIES: hypothetical protein [Paenibacillus]|uniref:Uncharacterized protein n=1 Tax=Paenibacillus odorifer TaxID=189426 RepID=A0AB36J2P8_9BACL|nr:hypothetical protein [Paenibacillus odorifer]OMD10590.1 hypothetical protein BJP50_28145 [Paenibacillus odorifer]OME07461.1 hypothetical protein BSK60_31565 [Paenibacillus odorifer]OME10250.1 hypothetical protein BSK47_30995 [Paenibacillus odorifer]
MKIKSILYMLVIVLTLNFVSSNVVLAAAVAPVPNYPPNAPVATPVVTPNPSVTPGPGVSEPIKEDNPWYMPEWVSALMEDFQQMNQTFKDLMSGKLIHDAIEGLIVSWVDEMMSPLYGAFAKSYLFSPRVAEISLVYSGWSIFSIIGLAAILAGSLVLAWNVIHGKKDLKKMLQAFIVSFVACLLSLTVLNFLNVLMNWITQKFLSGIIGTTDILYEGLKGDQILKSLILGADGITDAIYASKTLGEIVVATEGGIFTLLMFVTIVVVPLFFISVLKVLVLMMMAIFVAIWISYTAYSGKIETLIGFINIYIRTLLVGLISAIQYGIFVRLQTDYGEGAGFSSEIGVSPLVFMILSILVTVILIFVFWVRPLFRAIKRPMTLNGGATIEKLGEMGERTSTAMNSVGKRLGADSLQKGSLSLKQKSSRIAEVGKRMQTQQKGTRRNRVASKLTGGISESIQGVKYTEPEALVSTGTMVSVDSGHLELEDDRIIESNQTVAKTLQKDKFEHAEVINIKNSERADMSRLIKEIKPQYGERINWNAREGKLTLKGDTGEIKERINGEMLFTTSDVQRGYYKNGLFIDTETLKTHVDGSEASKSELKKVKNLLPTYRKAALSADVAKEAYKQLNQQVDKMPWVSKIRLDNGALWIPEEHVTEAEGVFKQLLAKPVDLVRLDLPKGNRFMPALEEHIKLKSKNKDLLAGLQINSKDTYVIVKKDLEQAFKSALEEFRDGRTPYWRTREGNIKVIVDGEPVSYGQAPIPGMDMGSFENFQAEMINKHKS